MNFKQFYKYNDKQYIYIYIYIYYVINVKVWKDKVNK